MRKVLLLKVWSTDHSVGMATCQECRVPGTMDLLMEDLHVDRIPVTRAHGGAGGAFRRLEHLLWGQG